ncbi:MAG: T9SS type A sorting domain-containing protein [Bacteroidia bacterium]|nr:T9SS type A sorting domain-containing protein [Bacteroidia bacterium]MDW8159694.1 T9SS type A sorting domain-containing protein [Bacteroidia bacterium]
MVLNQLSFAQISQREKVQKKNNEIVALSNAEQDCESAILLRTRFYSNSHVYTGYGRQREVLRETCLSSGETHSVWFRFRVYRSGTLGLIIETDKDYDFLLYNITGLSCAELPNAPLMRCNFSSTPGITGLDTSIIADYPISHASRDIPMMPGLSVTAGQEYVLMLNSWQVPLENFNLRITGSCSISPFVELQHIIAPTCLYADTIVQIALEFDSPLNCNVGVIPTNFQVTNSQNQICPISNIFCMKQGQKGILRLAVRLNPGPLPKYHISYAPITPSDSLRGEDGKVVAPFSATFETIYLPTPDFVFERLVAYCKNRPIIARCINSNSNMTLLWEATPPVLIEGSTEVKSFIFQEGGAKIVSLQFVSGACTSRKVTQSLMVNPIPFNVIALPRCGAGSVSLSILGDFPHNQVFEIYSSPTARPVATLNNPPYIYTTPNLRSSTTYYVKGVWPAACSLDQEFTAVPIIIHRTPELPQNITSSPLGCGTNTAKIEVELGPSNGHDVFLYTSSTADSLVLAVNKSNYRQYFQLIISGLTTHVTYFLETKDTTTGCRSLRRLPVGLRIMPVPDAPIAPRSVTICGKGSAKIIAAMGRVPGKGIRLYTTCGVRYSTPYVGDNSIAAADEPPYVLETPEVSTTTTFYLHAWNPAEGMICIGGTCPPCFSACTPVVVRVEEEPPLPTGPTLLSRCGPGTFTIRPEITRLDGVRLYDRPVGGNLLSEANELPMILVTPLVTQTTSFYLETYSLASGCSSSKRLPVLAVVHPIPLAPQATNVVRCGPGPVTLTVKYPSTMPSNYQLQIYTTPQISIPIAISYKSPWEFSIPNLNQSQTLYIRTHDSRFGCISDSTVVALIVNPLPTPPSIIVQNISNEPLVVWQRVVGAEFYELRYKKKEELLWKPEITVNDTFYQFRNLEEGEYEVSVRSICGDYASEWSTSQSFRVQVTSIEFSEVPTEVNIYPNPSQGVITVIWAKENNINSIELWSSDGKKCWSQKIDSPLSIINLDFSSLPSGLYILGISDKDTKTRYFKLLLQR